MITLCFVQPAIEVGHRGVQGLRSISTRSTWTEVSGIRNEFAAARNEFGVARVDLVMQRIFLGSNGRWKGKSRCDET